MPPAHERTGREDAAQPGEFSTAGRLRDASLLDG